MPDSAIALLFLLFAGLAIASISWHFSRARSMLERWAGVHGYQLLHSEYRYLSKGPFFWTSSRDQAVYYVIVRDRSGVERRGYVRCGGWWLGLFNDKVEVRWEDE